MAQDNEVEETEVVEDSPSFDVAFESPYPTPLSAGLAGRWFESRLTSDREIGGVVWTDDENGFGFYAADAVAVPDAEPLNQYWSAFRTRVGSDGLAASDAFEAATLDEYSRVGAAPEVSTGTLEPVTELVDGLGESDPDAVVAAAETSGEGVESTYNFTVTEDEDVVELIRSDSSGIYVRQDGEWVQANTDEEQPTIDDLEWIEVTEDAVAFWDDRMSLDEPITREDVLQFSVERDD